MKAKVKLKKRTKALSIKEAPEYEHLVVAPREGEFFDLEEASEKYHDLTKRAAHDLMECGEFDHFVVEVINPARANVHHTPTGKIWKYENKPVLGWSLARGEIGRKEARKRRSASWRRFE